MIGPGIEASYRVAPKARPRASARGGPQIKRTNMLIVKCNIGGVRNIYFIDYFYESN